MSLVPSAESPGLSWQGESGSGKHLEGPVSGLPMFKDTLRVPWSHSFSEDVSWCCFGESPEVKDTVMLLELKVKALLLLCRWTLGEELLCSDSVEEWLPTEASEWLHRGL